VKLINGCKRKLQSEGTRKDAKGIELNNGAKERYIGRSKEKEIKDEAKEYKRNGYKQTRN